MRERLERSDHHRQKGKTKSVQNRSLRNRQQMFRKGRIMVDITFMLDVVLKQRQFKSQDHWNRQQVEAHQQRMVHILRRHTYENSPFYQHFHTGLYDAPLDQLPVLTKAQMMDQFDSLVTDRTVHLEDIKRYMQDLERSHYFLGRYVINATSGSSGHPAIVLWSRGEWATTMASAFARTPIPFSFIHKRKLAQIASTTAFHMSAQGGTSAQNLLMPTLLLGATEPLNSMVRRLNDWQPDVLVVYASMGRILADEQLAGRLKIAPQAVMVGSEVLTAETRRRIEEAWGQHVFNNYATTEVGGIAVECDQHRGMHVMEDLVMVENVDKDNQPVPPGVFGDKLLVTPLYKRTQPLIRYVIEDRVRFSSEPCPCGRPFKLIDAIEGRIQEVLSFRGADGGEVRIHPLLFHNLLDMLPVSGWQVVQEADGLHILLAHVHGALNDNQIESQVQNALAAQKAVVSPIQVQRVDAIPQTIAGKAPLVKSNLASPSH
jgi:phenylacetate-CoA ligase